LLQLEKPWLWGTRTPGYVNKVQELVKWGSGSSLDVFVDVQIQQLIQLAFLVVVHHGEKHLRDEKGPRQHQASFVTLSRRFAYPEVVWYKACPIWLPPWNKPS
jgi:hypothetical protein